MKYKTVLVVLIALNITLFFVLHLLNNASDPGVSFNQATNKVTEDSQNIAGEDGSRKSVVDEVSMDIADVNNEQDSSAVKSEQNSFAAYPEQNVSAVNTEQVPAATNSEQNPLAVGTEQISVSAEDLNLPAEFDISKVYKEASSDIGKTYLEAIVFKVGSEKMFIDGFEFSSGLIESDGNLYFNYPKSCVFWGTGVTEHSSLAFKLDENKYTLDTAGGELAFEKNALTYEYCGKEFTFSYPPVVEISDDGFWVHIYVSFPIDVIGQILDLQMTYDKKSGIVVFSKEKIESASKYEKYYELPNIFGPMILENYTDFEYQLTIKTVRRLLDVDNRIAKRFIGYVGYAGPYDLAITLRPAYYEDEVYSKDEETPPVYISTPLLTDGVIFMTDKDNPVENLTIEDLHGIYTGRITNWKELGGNDQVIIAPFFKYRDEILMQVLGISDVRVFEGYSPADDANSEKGSTYGGILGDYEIGQSIKYGYPPHIPQTGIYSRSKGGLNMSLYFYNKDNDRGYKILKINDTEANDETVLDKTYPLLIDYDLHVNENSRNNEYIKAIADMYAMH
jgi:hypothetical protein